MFVLFASCSERIIVSDADSLGLRYKVKSMDESFYIAHTSFDSIVLHKKIYQYKYKFYHDCRYSSIEKTLYLNSLPCDSVKNHFPFAYKESEYSLIDYKYVSDSFTTLEFLDKQGNSTGFINRKYSNSRLLAEEKYSASGDLISKTGFRYDSDNRLQNKTIFYENSYIETNYEYSAGEKFESGNEFNYRYKFDVNGRISSKKTYKGITFLSETCFYYNDYGDVVMQREIDKNGIIKNTQYEYIYDSGNNWILCVEYNCTGNIFVRKREITYYS
jgi:hypothetical protein